jgi:hypothetical protein
MKLKKRATVLLSAAFAFLVATQPIFSRPSRLKDCCGPSCPQPEKRQAPACCKMLPASSQDSVAATAQPIFVAAADAASPALADTRRVVVLSSAVDRPPSQRHRLASSGLSPPRLA